MSDNKVLIGDMDRKTCIEILKRLLEVMETFDGISPSPERINALKMAIASLETDEAYQLEYESTTKNDLGVDCISIAEVNQVIEDYMDEQYHVLSDRTRERAFGANAVKARINELPSVTPIRPKGNWINIDATHSQCDKCSAVFEIISANGEANYCPNCGSDNR